MNVPFFFFCKNRKLLKLLIDNVPDAGYKIVVGFLTPTRGVQIPFGTPKIGALKGQGSWEDPTSLFLLPPESWAPKSPIGSR